MQPWPVGRSGGEAAPLNAWTADHAQAQRDAVSRTRDGFGDASNSFNAASEVCHRAAASASFSAGSSSCAEPNGPQPPELFKLVHMLRASI